MHPFSRIEKKWQRYWETHKTFKAVEDPSIPREKRKYVLDMFPYPSAAGLHVGHPEGYTATDIYCRYLRMKGYAVLHPMGFDSFGLPAETYALKTGTHPRVTTETNIERFRQQIKSLGFSYDWDREVSTHNAEYYRWTQWIFLKLYEKGLVYEAETPVWYCENLKTILANEEVIATSSGPRSEREHHPVTRILLKQWMMKITAYADRLEKGLDALNWPESIIRMQKNWIGRSEGTALHFEVKGHDQSIEVFTTRADTLCGATYLTLAPEHPLVQKITTSNRMPAVQQYLAKAALKSDLERTDLAKEKTGVYTGAEAINPVNGASIPIWVADYVLAGYGTGAIMAVPAHDQRDWDFATTYHLPIVKVIARSKEDDEPLSEVMTDEGILIKSKQFTGMESAQAREIITKWLEKKGKGRKNIQYRMRDWIFSRQRYWGEPIPLLKTGNGNVEPLASDELPLELPDIQNYHPAGQGQSPLAALSSWVHTHSKDGTPATRETHTMPQWAGSCWYYLRYLDPHNTQEFASKEKIDYWMPVDLYVGGAEHAVLHLLYARFWHMVLYDLGLVNTEEPFARLVNQGMILGENGQKMSKSLGNVINPDEILDEYGADTMRLYEMFMGPLQQEKPWRTTSIRGIERFLSRVWQLSDRVHTDKGQNDSEPSQDLMRLLHKTIKKVSEDTENLAFNTAISQMMIYANALSSLQEIPLQCWESFILLLAPYAPHLGEELWEKIGHTPSVSQASWPLYDPDLIKDEQFTLVVQISGKTRHTLSADARLEREELLQFVLGDKKVQKMIEGKTVRRQVVVPGRLVNLVCE